MCIASLILPAPRNYGRIHSVNFAEMTLNLNPLFNFLKWISGTIWRVQAIEHG